METMEQAWERWGGVSYDALAAALADTDREHAALHARHGPGGTAESQRKAHRCAKEVQLRAAAREAGQKLTDKEAEAMAASDPDVVALLDTMEAERARLAVLESEREAIRERMRYLRGVVYCASAEARLAA